MEEANSVRQSPIKVSRCDIVREASKRVPLNYLNLPEGFHRADLLHSDVIRKVVPYNDLLQTPQGHHAPKLNLSDGEYTDPGPLIILDDKAIRAAYIPLDYSEGFPTLPKTGVPFWHHLDFEPADAFWAFERYLDQGKTEGSRRLFSLACDQKLQQQLIPHKHPQLSLADSNLSRDDYERQQVEESRKVASQVNAQLQEYYTLYYWGPRSRAHDLFYLDAIRRNQHMTALRLSNDHYEDSSRLYNEVMRYINGDKEGSTNDEGIPRFWADMTPRVLVDFMKVLAHMQRVSTGLPGAAPPSINDPHSALGILRSLTGMDPALAGPDNAGGSSRGRPQIRYDENNNLISSNPSSRNPPSASPYTTSGGGEQGNISNEDMLRRISVIMSKARARRDVERALDQTSDLPAESDD